MTFWTKVPGRGESPTRPYSRSLPKGSISKLSSPIIYGVFPYLSLDGGQETRPTCLPRLNVEVAMGSVTAQKRSGRSESPDSSRHTMVRAVSAELLIDFGFNGHSALLDGK